MRVSVAAVSVAGLESVGYKQPQPKALPALPGEDARTQMNRLFSALQRSWGELGRVDSRYEVLLDKIVPHLLDGSYVLDGWLAKYSRMRGTAVGVVGSGSNGRIVLAETHDGVEVAVKVTLAMDGAQHEQRMLHHCLQYRVPVVEILDTFADKTVSVTVMKLEGTNWSLDNGVVYPLFAGLMHTRVVDKSRRVNVRDLYACLKMHTSFGGMPLHRIKHVFAQLVSAVAALHNVAGVSHGDLKLQNVLIDESLRVTIVDLSAAKFISEGHVKRFAGAPSYGSPEAMRGFAFSGPLNDIWSLGIMLYMLRYGADQEPSFTGIAAPLERRQLGKVNVDVYTWSKEHSKKHRLILPPRDSKDKLDDQLRDLLGLILQYDMSKRSSLEDIQCHPFLAVAGVGGAGVVERVDSGVCDLEAGRGGVRKQPFWHSFFSSSSEAKTGQV